MSYNYVKVIGANDWELYQLIPNGTTGNDNIEENNLTYEPEVDKYEPEVNNDSNVKQNILCNEPNTYNKYNKNNYLVGFGMN